MDESEFEGTLVLEKLAEIDAVDFAQARELMKRANVDQQTIAVVLKKMSEAGGDH